MLRSSLFLALALCTAAPAFARDRIRLEIDITTENQYARQGEGIFVVQSSQVTTSGHLFARVNGRSHSQAIPAQTQAGEAAGRIEVLSHNKIRIVGSDLSTQIDVEAIVGLDGTIYAGSNYMGRAMRALIEPQLSQWRREMSGRVQGNIEVHADSLRCNPRPEGLSCAYGAKLVLWVAQ